MKVTESVLSAAAAFLAPAHRAEQQEAWQADLRDCMGLGFTPAAIATGALRTALSVDNFRALTLHHTTQAKESTMRVTCRPDVIRLVIALVWTLVSAALLFVALNHLQQSGSNLGYTFTPGGASIELIPIVVGAATAALLAVVGYGVLAIRRGQIGARRTATNV